MEVPFPFLLSLKAANPTGAQERVAPNPALRDSIARGPALMELAVAKQAKGDKARRLCTSGRNRPMLVVEIR